MQRLKQNNWGAVLPLDEKELLSARATQTLPDGSWCTVRMRIATSGEAERSIHFSGGPDHKAFHHESVMIPAHTLAAIVAAVRLAFQERASFPKPEEDPQALYRGISFRDGDERPKGLAVEYRYEKAVGPASAFEAAWRLWSMQFPHTGIGQGSIVELVW